MTDSVIGPPSSRTWRQLPESGVVCRPGSRSAEGLAALERADASFEAGDFDTSARECVAAIDALEGTTGELLVEANRRLGRAHHARGNVSSCLHYYRRALELDPRHAPTLRALVDLHLEWGEHLEAEAVERNLFAAQPTPEQLEKELIRSGDRWWKRAKDVGRAKRRYREALTHTQQRQRVVTRLRAISVSTPSDHHELSIRATRARTATARAEAFFELGVATWFELGDLEGSGHAFEAAFLADRSMLVALEMLVTVLLERGDFVQLERMAGALAYARDETSLAARAHIRSALASLPEGALASQAAAEQLLAWQPQRVG